MGVILNSRIKVRDSLNQKILGHSNHVVKRGNDYLVAKIFEVGNTISEKQRKETVRERNFQAV